MSEARKCEVVAGPPYRLNPCSFLADLIGEKGQGIRRQQLVNIRTMEPTRESWSIRSGIHAKNGILLNFCPMCGSDLQGLFRHLLEDATEPV